ncbi:hypothetical protein [Thiolapillus sp.]|uniref:hypothetical protein n=1 Tax=Thiolapillus sp. TaxID=2017437 RepID=UPI003AF87865
MKYYIVEFTYSGPNRNDAEHVDFNRFEITTTPPRHASGYICWEGWLSTSDNVTRFALGQYDRLAAAEYRLQTGPLLRQRYRRDPVDDLPPDVLAVYRPGRLPPMSDNALDQWLECSVHITADDGNRGLARRAVALRYELEEDGYSVTMGRMLFALAFRLDRAREERED